MKIRISQKREKNESLKIIAAGIFAAIVFTFIFIGIISSGNENGLIHKALNFLAQYEFYFVVFLLIFTAVPKFNQTMNFWVIPAFKEQ